MKVKELERTVNVAWSPASYHPILLAAGTAAQQLDASFSTSASLELYSLNLAEPGLDVELKCSVPSQNRFHKVVWGGGCQNGSAGVVVGSCDGGKLQMYNVNKILGGEDGLVSHQDRHSGAVRSLDFNPFQTNLLASGASESEIFIWDLNNTSTPMTPGAKAQPFEDVMSLAWNRQVQHILASTFATRCIVWDLRKNEPIIKLTDSNSRVRWKVVAWNPDVATQLCLASEEDSNPVVQLWDLRFATTPLKCLQAHSRGVLSLAWCSQDSDLLISTGKDNRIICWNPNSNHPTGEIQCEISNTQQWIFELSWCPRNPNLIASCSADSHASIYNLTGAPMQSQTTNKIADSFPGMEQLSVDQPTAPVTQSTVELVKPPRWMRRPGGASFSFGGKLVSFGGDGGTVMVSQVSTDAEYLDRARNVLDMLNTGRAAELCSSRQDPVWSYLEATFAPHPHAAIKNLLGYTEVVTSKSSEPDIDALNNQMTGLGQEDVSPMSNNIMDDPYASNHVNGTEAFDSIAAKQEPVPTKKPTPNFHIPTGNDGEGSICKCLLGGDLEEAVSACLTEGRSADALVLAMVAGSSLLLKTQQKYFDSQNGSSKVEHLIRAIVTNDWNDFIGCCEVGSWKEALVALLTYARQDAIPQLCEELGKRLEEAGGEYALGADVCYITAGSIGSIIRKKITESNLSTPGAMQELVELVMVGEAAAICHGKQISTDGEVSDLFTDYALVLASQGDYQTALSYLQHTSGEQVTDLRERLHANMGIKQEYQQQGQFQQNQGYHQQQQNQPRRFSGQQQQQHPQQPQHTQQPHFNKMSPRAALMSNVYQQNQEPVPTFPPSSDYQDQQRSSHSPGLQHAGGGGKKYLIDPSVGGDSRSGRGGNKFYPGGSGMGMQEMAPTPFQPAPRTFEPVSHTGPAILNPLSQQPQPPPLVHSNRRQSGSFSAQNYLTGTPGWNDPPVLTSSKHQNKVEPIAPKMPIMNPLSPSPPDAYSGMATPGGMQPIGTRPPSGPFQPPGAPPSLGGPPTGLYARQMGAASPFPGSSPSPLGPPPLGASSQPPMGVAPPPMGVLPSQRKTSMNSAPPPMGAAPPPIGSTPSSLGMAMAAPSVGTVPSPIGVAPTSVGGTLPPMGTAPPSMGSVHPPMGASQQPLRNMAPPVGSVPLASAPPPMNSATPMGVSQPPMGSVPHHSALGQIGGPLPMGSGPPVMPLSSGLPPPPRPSSRLQQTPTPVPSATAFQQPPASSSPAPQVNGGYGDPPTPRHVAPHTGPLPDNLKPLQGILESLRLACFNASNNPQVKRKLEDTARKLESLYEALRESRLSQETHMSLEELVCQSREGNYQAALALHTRMISGPDFSQISSFMPALKVLIQSALQLNVYIQ